MVLSSLPEQEAPFSKHRSSAPPAVVGANEQDAQDRSPRTENQQSAASTPCAFTHLSSDETAYYVQGTMLSPEDPAGSKPESPAIMGLGKVGKDMKQGTAEALKDKVPESRDSGLY